MNTMTTTPTAPAAAQAHGANAWQHPKTGAWRWYVGEQALASAIGLVTDRYGTGSIKNATLGGEKISNTKASKILFALSRAKVWYDENGALHIDGASSEMSAMLGDAL